MQLGALDFNLGRLDQADGEFKEAARLYPGYPYALAGRAQVAAAGGDDGGAIALCQQVVARQPVPQFVAALGDVLQRAGRGAEAQRQFGLVGVIKQLFEANGVKDDLTLILFDLDHGCLGAALYRAGRLDEARVHAEEAPARGAKDPLFLFHAGIIAKAQGNNASARDHLRAVEHLKPRFSVGACGRGGGGAEGARQPAQLRIGRSRAVTPARSVGFRVSAWQRAAIGQTELPGSCVASLPV